MTAKENKAGAASHEKVEYWHQINWYKAYQNVRRLQARIVKALQQGKRGKVKALQRLLTRSFSGKTLAVKRVTENSGKRTPGVDQVVWDTPEKKIKAVQCLKQRGYKAQPLRRIYIAKSNGKKRPLGIPTMKCRAMQALYLLALDPISETTADNNSYGFRRERSTADAVAQCFHVLSKKRSAQWILEGDIRSCFDRISHNWLLNHIPLEKPILRKWLKAGFMERNILHPTKEGTPQGGIASPVLANMALDGLEHELRKRFPKPKHGFNAKVNLSRYADDFIITGASKEILETQVKPLVISFLGERGLELSKEKTRITHIGEGFDFLGQNIRKYKEKLIIKPSQKSAQNFLKKVRFVIKSNKQATPGNLIMQLNPLIKGWTMYHRHIASKQTFNKVGYHIFQSLWQWAKRRHPRKGAKWIRQKYFKTVGTFHWVFFGIVTNKKPMEVYLLSPTSIPIKRHPRIKDGANPYDPEWEMYFEKRSDVKMSENLKGRRHILYLWKEQKGLCPYCKQKITKITGWHSHHITWRSKGGHDNKSNRVLLHPTCHRAIHSLGISITKPSPSEGL